MLRTARGVLLTCTLLASALPLTGCQSPSDSEDSLKVDDFVDVSVAANIDAQPSTDGRTYRVVRGNNQPDEIIPFDYHTAFNLSVTINNNATKDSVDLDFPVKLSSATVKVEQASGGIVSPPTGGEVEHYDSAPSNVSGNSYPNANSTISMTYDIWYKLPSQRKEALISVTLTFVDDSNVSFSKVVQVRVNP
jgi:hypothetical protein